MSKQSEVPRGDDELTTSAIKDEANVTPEGRRIAEHIDGVQVRDLHHVVTANGVTTELWRADWPTPLPALDQIIHVVLEPGVVSAWHLHRHRWDALLCVGGSMRVVLYDARRTSPTTGKVDVLNLSHVRPTLVAIPPAVWHGVQTHGHEPVRFVNCFDRAYNHADPDEWRLPPDTEEIPYRFS